MARCLQATYTVVSFHIGIAIGGLPEFIMYPIGAILFGRKLLHDWNPSTHRHLRLRSPQLILFLVSCMNSVSRRRSRTSLVAMIVGGLLAVAPVFGPLGKPCTIWPTSSLSDHSRCECRISLFRRTAGFDCLSLRTAHVCHIAGFLYPKWEGNHAARMITTSASIHALRRT